MHSFSLSCKSKSSLFWWALIFSSRSFILPVNLQIISLVSLQHHSLLCPDKSFCYDVFPFSLENEFSRSLLKRFRAREDWNYFRNILYFQTSVHCDQFFSFLHCSWNKERKLFICNSIYGIAKPIPVREFATIIVWQVAFKISVFFCKIKYILNA